MKQHKHHVYAKQPTLIAFLFSFIALLSFSCPGYAQWTFTGSAYCSGCTPGYQNGSFSLVFTTESQCEQKRQSVIAYLSSQRGAGLTSFSCGPCTGSDITQPGDVDFNGPNDGSPYQTAHVSASVPDEGDQVQLKATSQFGLNSLSSKIDPYQNDVDYANFVKDASSFNPVVMMPRDQQGDPSAYTDPNSNSVVSAAVSGLEPSYIPSVADYVMSDAEKKMWTEMEWTNGEFLASSLTTGAAVLVGVPPPIAAAIGVATSIGVAEIKKEYFESDENDVFTSGLKSAAAQGAGLVNPELKEPFELGVYFYNQYKALAPAGSQQQNGQLYYVPKPDQVMYPKY